MWQRGFKSENCLIFQINQLKDENEKIRSRVRELESQTVQLIGEKKTLENNLEEMKSTVVEPATAVAPVVVQPDVDQVFI